MSTSQPSKPFRFLELPGEIRNSIYDLLLCTWEDECEEDPDMISKFVKRRPSYAATSLLSVNRQINKEAFDYMAKRNQFVRISFQGFENEKMFLGDQIPVISTTYKHVIAFRASILRITMSNRKRSRYPNPASDLEVMMLRTDLPKLCEQLDVESMMNPSPGSYVPIHTEIRVCPYRARSDKVQEHLLSPLSTSLRGLLSTKILAPIPRSLARVVTEDVAQPRWTDPAAVLGEIGTGIDVGKRQWEQNKVYEASDSWAYAMLTLERMRHSSSWPGLEKSGGLSFVNATADLYYTLHLLHAQFLEYDMTDDATNDDIVLNNGALAINHLFHCETTSQRFSQNVDSTWTPTNQQSAIRMLRQARCFRLMGNPNNRVTAMALIQEAAVLAPNDLAIRDEKEAVFRWNDQVLDKVQLRERLAVKQRTVQSTWASIWAAVAELAS